MPRKLPGIVLQETAFFSIQNCFRGNFAIHSCCAELELLGPGLWILVPSESVFFPQKQQQLGTAVPKPTGSGWPKRSRGTDMEVGSCPRQCQSQGIDTAGGRLSQVGLLHHLVFFAPGESTGFSTFVPVIIAVI